jgi:alcohol-forming fatty acyl-CoA reductase
MVRVIFLAQVFDRIRSTDDAEKVFEKVVCINGDVSDPDLGLSAEDRQRLCSDVTIVFHSAATVKFNETLRTAVTLNTLGTQRVVDLCRSMPKLKVRTRKRTLELFFPRKLQIKGKN